LVAVLLQAKVTTGSTTTTVNFPFSFFNGSYPICIENPSVGSTDVSGTYAAMDSVRRLPETPSSSLCHCHPLTASAIILVL
jgi:hypothetical protein